MLYFIQYRTNINDTKSKSLEASTSSQQTSKLHILGCLVEFLVTEHVSSVLQKILRDECISLLN